MAEYIEREELQARLKKKKAGPANKRYTEGWNDAILTVKSMVHGAPAADVASVRHGRWGYNGIPDSMLSGCSVCGFTCGSYTFNYCPNCGAKMDAEERNVESD